MPLEHGHSNHQDGWCAKCEINVPAHVGKELVDPHPHVLCNEHWFQRISENYHLLSFEKRPASNMQASINPKKEYNIPWKYSYQYNSFGFRSPEFHEDTNIVALGCSHTFGVGVPKDFIWTSFVSEITGINDVINLGVPGASVPLCVRLLSTYINEYGSPKIVLCNFPDFHRYEVFDDIGRAQMGSSASANYEDFSKTNIFSYIQNLQAINFLEAMCKANKIKLVWQIWVSQVSSLEKLHVSEEFFKNKFKSFKSLENHDVWNPDREDFKYKTKTNEIIYIGKSPEIKCCENIYEKTKDFFHFGYDRYKVPKKLYHKMITEDYFNKNLAKTTFPNWGREAHFGAHSHYHWAKNLVGGI